MKNGILKLANLIYINTVKMNSEMYDHVIFSYPDAVKVAIQIMDFLNKTYRIKITNEEMTYLVIHIQRNLIRK